MLQKAKRPQEVFEAKYLHALALYNSPDAATQKKGCAENTALLSESVGMKRATDVEGLKAGCDQLK